LAAAAVVARYTELFSLFLQPHARGNLRTFLGRSAKFLGFSGYFFGKFLSFSLLMLKCVFCYAVMATTLLPPVFAGQQHQNEI